MLNELNIKEQCDYLKVRLWECPHFLFIIMGGVTIMAMIGTNIVARYYADPELAALVVISVTSILFVISHIIVQSFERIAQASRARAEFISIVSHQLRNPLSSIRWQLEVLMRGTTLDQKTRAYVEGINEYNNRMTKLVNDLLTVNRIESNRLVLTSAAFSLVDMTHKVVEDNTLFARASNITLDIHANKDIPPVFADETHIRWAVENLVGNAIRYSNPRSTINITVVKKGVDVLWQITNQGVSISTSDTQYIFKKFFRAESSIRKRTEGSGLGLFIAKAVVEASDGTIDFSSKQTGETKFWFTLPRAQKSKKLSPNVKT